MRSSRSDRRSGDLLADGLWLVDLVGGGGMGEIWRAHHGRLGTDVAVKLLRANTLVGDARGRFEIEARAAAGIKSPHVVRVFDHGETPDGEPYIVMELLEGESLADRLDRVGKLAPGEVVDLVHQIASALDEVHAMDVVHRDIKPDNLWLVPQRGGDFVKLLDFGIACAHRLLAHTARPAAATSSVGTPSYMSPERLRAPGSVDYRADLWGLSVCAYEMLTGRLPFEGETVGGVVASVLGGAHVPPTHRCAVSPAVDDFFARAFAAEPPARFTRATELADALDAALDHEQRSESESIQVAISWERGGTSSARPISSRVPVVLDEEIERRPRRDVPRPTLDRRDRAVLGAAVVVSSAVSILIGAMLGSIEPRIARARNELTTSVVTMATPLLTTNELTQPSGPKEAKPREGGFVSDPRALPPEPQPGAMPKRTERSRREAPRFSERF